MKMSEVNINDAKLKNLILKIDRVIARLSTSNKRMDHVELTKDGVTYKYENWTKASELTGISSTTMFKVRHGEALTTTKGMDGYIIPDEYIIIKKVKEPKYTLELNGVRKKFSTQLQAAEYYKVSQSTIGAVVSGKERKGIKVVN